MKMLDPPLIGTHAEVMWVPMVMLPMPDSSNSSDRALEMAAIMFHGWLANSAHKTQHIVTRMI